MRPISTIFQNKPQELLYHYTTQKGLIGIIEKRSIWASKVQHLNDTQEFKLALNLAKKALEKKSKDAENAIQNKIDQMIEDLEEIPSINVFVCSFTEEDDLLSQWRAYSSFGNGYAIGFSSKILQQRHGFFLAKCIYEENIQKAVIDQLVEETLDNKKGIDSAVGIYDPRLGFINCLVSLAPMIKHSSFKEEAEWRLISGPKAIGLQFRPGRSTIIPYVDFQFCAKDAASLCKIITGPSPEPELKKAAVQSLLLYNGFTNCEVKESSVTYRDW